MTLSRVNPYQHVSFAPVDFSDPQTPEAITSSTVPELTAGRPNHRRMTDVTDLDQHMREFTFNDYEERWAEMWVDYGTELRDIIAARVPTVPSKIKQQYAPVWTIQIFGTIFGDEEPLAVMGFHHGNKMSIYDVHCAVYIMLSPLLRPRQWTLTPAIPGAADLSWDDRGDMLPGSYVWCLDGKDKISFSTPEDYWYKLKEKKVADPSGTSVKSKTGSAPAESQPENTMSRDRSIAWSLMPGNLIALRDGGYCRLCNLPLIFGNDGVFAHVIPFSRPDGAAKFAMTLDPGGYISYSQCEKSTPGHTHSLITGEYFARAITNHPSNLIQACQSCERTLDRLEFSINVFAQPPKRVVALGDETTYNDNQRQALLDRHKPGMRVNLDSGLGPAFHTISISKFMLALHYHAFLSRWSRVDIAAIHALRAGAAAAASISLDAGMMNLNLDHGEIPENADDLGPSRSEDGSRANDDVDHGQSHDGDDGPSPDASLKTPAPDSPDRGTASVSGAKASLSATGGATFEEIDMKAPRPYDKLIDVEDWSYGVGPDS